MPTDFDALRKTPLPDSFDRTADWLRSAPPPPSRTRPLALGVALAVVVGACAVPVASDAVVGWAVEVVAADGLEVVRALDAAVPAEDRLSADVAPAGDLEAVVYVVLEDGAAERARARAEAEGFDVRVRPLGLEVRQPLGLAAARWLGVSGSPRVSDADLQLALDRAFAGHALAPRVERGPDGRRALALGSAFRIRGLDPETRVARRGSTVSITGGDLSGLEVGGVPIGRLRGADEGAVEAALDSALAAARARPGTAEVRVLDAPTLARLDSLGLSPAVLDSLAAGAGTVRQFLVRIDSTDTL